MEFEEEPISESGSENEAVQAPPAIYKKEKLEEKLNRIKKVTLKILNKFSKKKLKKVPWIEHLSISSEETIKPVDIPNAHSDLKRELAFYNMTVANVKQGLERLEELKVPTERPADYLVEMLKSDVQMRKVKQKLLAQQNNINKFEERKRRKEDQKFAKKIKAAKEQEKHKKKKKALQEIEEWKKTLKEKKGKE